MDDFNINTPRVPYHFEDMIGYDCEVDEFQCRTCGWSPLYEDEERCPNCGQLIDWEHAE